tara:strand:- start:139 stop:828 length:690 start_codon:yes stop_codon:yes gene_type:complete
MLTKKQYELLKFLNVKIKTNGVAPSFEEMKDAIGLKSKSGIHRLITSLEERGFVRRLPHRARALEIIKLPENINQPIKLKHEFKPNVIDGGIANEPEQPTGNKNYKIPLFGRIAAGVAIDAIRDDTNMIEIPEYMLGEGEHYALEVEGDSMIDLGIFPGDLAVIKRSDTAENGEIVVALIDENEVTLKRMHRKGETIALEPANKQYETKIFGPDRVRIQGHLQAILRQY